jgi:hypothetical protein
MRRLQKFFFGKSPASPVEQTITPNTSRVSSQASRQRSQGSALMRVDQLFDQVTTHFNALREQGLSAEQESALKHYCALYYILQCVNEASSVYITGLLQQLFKALPVIDKNLHQATEQLINVCRMRHSNPATMKSASFEADFFNNPVYNNTTVRFIILQGLSNYQKTWDHSILATQEKLRDIANYCLQVIDIMQLLEQGHDMSVVIIVYALFLQLSEQKNERLTLLRTHHGQNILHYLFAYFSYQDNQHMILNMQPLLTALSIQADQHGVTPLHLFAATFVMPANPDENMKHALHTIMTASVPAMTMQDKNDLTPFELALLSNPQPETIIDLMLPHLSIVQLRQLLNRTEFKRFPVLTVMAQRWVDIDSAIYAVGTALKKVTLDDACDDCSQPSTYPLLPMFALFTDRYLGVSDYLDLLAFNAQLHIDDQADLAKAQSLVQKSIAKKIDQQRAFDQLIEYFISQRDVLKIPREHDLNHFKNFLKGYMNYVHKQGDMKKESLQRIASFSGLSVLFKHNFYNSTVRAIAKEPDKHQHRYDEFITLCRATIPDLAQKSEEEIIDALTLESFVAFNKRLKKGNRDPLAENSFFAANKNLKATTLSENTSQNPSLIWRPLGYYASLTQKQ